MKIEYKIQELGDGYVILRHDKDGLTWLADPTDGYAVWVKNVDEAYKYTALKAKEHKDTLDSMKECSTVWKVKSDTIVSVEIPAGRLVVQQEPETEDWHARYERVNSFANQPEMVVFTHYIGMRDRVSLAKLLAMEWLRGIEPSYHHEEKTIEMEFILIAGFKYTLAWSEVDDEYQVSSPIAYLGRANSYEQAMLLCQQHHIDNTYTEN